MADLHADLLRNQLYLALWRCISHDRTAVILRKQRRLARHIKGFNVTLSFHTRQVISGDAQRGDDNFLVRPRCHGVGSKKQDGDITREPAPVTGVVVGQTYCWRTNTRACIRIGPTKAYTRSLRLIIITGGAEADFRSTYTRSVANGRWERNHLRIFQERRRLRRSPRGRL